MDQPIQYERYQRQIILKGFGMAGQQKLQEARVLVVGAGGLGCPIMQYLVAAGIGHIGLADHDKVSLSNLHRQILFGTEDINSYKVDVVKQKMLSLNSDVNIRTWNERWTQQHCVQHFPDYDVIIDATDNFASRYLINDACVLMGKPLVFGAVSQFDGQAAVFNQLQADGSRSVNYRDLFPLPPANGEVLNCAEGGVLGVLPGTVGAMQATEAIKLITGIGTTLSNRLWNYNALTQDVFIMQLVANPLSLQHIPLSEEQFISTDYEQLCGIQQKGIKEIDLLDWQENFLDHLFVDIREPYELPRLGSFCSSLGLEWMELPLSNLENNISHLIGKNVVFVCQGGVRSLMAAGMLMKASPDSAVLSLKGGVRMLGEKNII
jgi:molybdopterin/thiamine biosynthesis adenylyltransferase/rhodanese-related sulfurtransferase